MRIAHTITELKSLRRELILARQAESGQRPVVGCVPTMGALHAGHVSLLSMMRGECDVRVATIFVNPTQFGPGEDLAKYPRTLHKDAALCEAAGVNLIFAPSAAEMYPAGFETTVSVSGITERWCGASRAGHFDGVTTIVAKLFSICQPDRAYFGEKDYQQLAVIRRLVRDLNLQVEISGCAIVRETDGLALSSRNAYLTEAERAVAPLLQQALITIAAHFAAGEQSTSELVSSGERVLAGAEPGFRLEYLAVVDPQTLDPREIAEPGDRVLIAAHLGPTRLIDNIGLPAGSEN